MKNNALSLMILHCSLEYRSEEEDFNIIEFFNIIAWKSFLNFVRTRSWTRESFPQILASNTTVTTAVAVT